MEENPLEKLQKKIKELSQAYILKLPQKMEELEEKWQKILDEGLSLDLKNEVYAIVHKLAGSASTFSLPMISQLSNDLQNLFSEIDIKKLDEDKKKQIINLLQELKSQVLKAGQ